MARHLYADLAWLPEAPADFRQRNRDLLESSEAGLGAAVRQLATHSLDDRQLAKLASTIGDLQAKGADLAPLTPFKLGLIGTGTLDLLAPMLVASAARHGVLLECVLADYGQVVQEALQPTSKLNQAKPDAILLALDHRSLPIAAEIA